MKPLTKLVSVTGGLALMMVAGASVAGIVNSKHDFSVNSTAGNHLVSSSTATDQICVFCHTPHGSNTSVGAPLWNKAVSDSSSYTTYTTANSSTMDGQVISVGSVSIACLSCHDGTQAFANVINEPGTGASGGPGPVFTPVSLGTMTEAQSAANFMSLPGDEVMNIGLDLRNDHPVGVEYCGGGPNSATPAAACKDGDFAAPSNTTLNGTTVFWVNTTAGASANREQQDMILYTRTFTGGDGPSVECASCHNPHMGGNAVGEPARLNGKPMSTMFLRMGGNGGSKVCLACHNK